MLYVDFDIGVSLHTSVLMPYIVLNLGKEHFSLWWPRCHWKSWESLFTCCHQLPSIRTMGRDFSRISGWRFQQIFREWLLRSTKARTLMNHLHIKMHWLVVWNMIFIFPIILGLSSSQLTFTPSFFRWVGSTTNQYIYIYILYIHINHYKLYKSL